MPDDRPLPRWPLFLPAILWVWRAARAAAAAGATLNGAPYRVVQGWSAAPSSGRSDVLIAVREAAAGLAPPCLPDWRLLLPMALWLRSFRRLTGFSVSLAAAPDVTPPKVADWRGEWWLCDRHGVCDTRLALIWSPPPRPARPVGRPAGEGDTDTLEARLDRLAARLEAGE